ncbi:MAG: radical SAM protein, partial [candidate division NC10 bacterium]
MKPAHLAYLLSCAARLAVGRPPIAIGGISITDVCNLDCVHCWRRNGGRGHVPFVRILDALRRLRSMGVRYLYFQGGEAFTWSEGALRLRDVVAAAKAMGFFHVAVATNGTFPLDGDPDSFSVSLEGGPEAHGRIRGETYDL